MGMYDEYEPKGALVCPACGAAIPRQPRWQGKDGPNRLLVWMQGERHPVSHAVDEERRLEGEDLNRFVLPQRFVIYSECSGQGHHWVEAECRCEGGVWCSLTLLPAKGWQ